MDMNILINAKTLAPMVANLLLKFDGVLFFKKALRPIQWHKVQLLLLVAWARLNFFFSISALTPSVKPLGLISTFAPIGMLDLG